MHSLELLKEAVKAEENGLQADQMLLEDLERDTRAEERRWKQRAKKVRIVSPIPKSLLTMLDASPVGATGNGGAA